MERADHLTWETLKKVCTFIRIHANNQTKQPVQTICPFPFYSPIARSIPQRSPPSANTIMFSPRLLARVQYSRWVANTKRGVSGTPEARAIICIKWNDLPRCAVWILHFSFNYLQRCPGHQVNGHSSSPSGKANDSFDVRRKYHCGTSAKILWSRHSSFTQAC